MLPCPPVLVLLHTEQFSQNILWGWSRSTNHIEGGRERRGIEWREAREEGERKRREKGREEEEAGFEGTKCREA